METLDEHIHTAKFVMPGSGAFQTVAAGATLWGCWGATGLFAAQLRLSFPFDVTMSNLRILLATAQPASGTMVVTAFLNTVATVVAKTIPAGGGAGLYTDANSVAVTGNRVLTVKFLNNAAAASAQIEGFSVEFSAIPTT
jgi:hypothetical protein